VPDPESETLPLKALLKGPRPPLLVSISPSHNLPASSTITASGDPTLAWVPAIWAPVSYLLGRKRAPREFFNTLERPRKFALTAF
jgi:hypothetical protein